MIRNIKAGIDIGTHSTRVVICEFLKGESLPKIIGIGEAPSRGLRHGYITDISETGKSVRRAVLEAEKNSGVKIKKAYVSIGGVSLESMIGNGAAVISKADGEVTILDTNKAISQSEGTLKISNRKIVHIIPSVYKLDGKEVLGRPEGMRGVKLEVKTLFITCLEQHLEDLVAAVAEAEVEVEDVIAAPIAVNPIVLSDKQRTAGCILVDIGAETVTISIFENGTIQSLHVFSIGSTDITNDIALGLRVPLEEAEGIKIGSIIGDYPRKKLDQIIDARLSDIFELIENYLKKIKRNGLLPAGVIIIGGGANIGSVEELSKSFLKLPSKIGDAYLLDNSLKGKIRDSSWFVALGLCLSSKNSNSMTGGNSFKKTTNDIKNFFKSITNQLMP